MPFVLSSSHTLIDPQSSLSLNNLNIFPNIRQKPRYVEKKNPLPNKTIMLIRDDNFRFDLIFIYKNN